MKTWCVSVFVVTAVALAAAPAMAQNRQRGGGGGVGVYLSAKSVQEELKISEDDAKKITDELGKIGNDVRGAERAEKTKKILSEGLKPEQMKRLNQIMWQRGGLSTALNNDEVVTALKLDDGQKEKIKAIRDDNRKAQAELRQGGQQPDRQKVQALQKETTEKLTAVLTEEQKKAWKELLGAEFKGEIPMGRRRPNM